MLLFIHIFISTQAYLANNIFLPDINNEKSQKNSSYVAQLTRCGVLWLSLSFCIFCIALIKSGV